MEVCGRTGGWTRLTIYAISQQETFVQPILQTTVIGNACEWMQETLSSPDVRQILIALWRLPLPFHAFPVGWFHFHQLCAALQRWGYKDESKYRWILGLRSIPRWWRLLEGRKEEQERNMEWKEEGIERNSIQGVPGGMCQTSAECSLH